MPRIFLDGRDNSQANNILCNTNSNTRLRALYTGV